MCCPPTWSRTPSWTATRGSSAIPAAVCAAGVRSRGVRLRIRVWRVPACRAGMWLLLPRAMTVLCCCRKKRKQRIHMGAETRESSKHRRRTKSCIRCMWPANDSFVKKTLKNLYFRPAKDELVTKPCISGPHVSFDPQKDAQGVEQPKGMRVLGLDEDVFSMTSTRYSSASFTETYAWQACLQNQTKSTETQNLKNQNQNQKIKQKCTGQSRNWSSWTTLASCASHPRC